MIRKLAFLAAAAAIALASPAQAKLATWAKFGPWLVQGDSQNGTCSATVVYDNGRGLSVVFNKVLGGSLVISDAGTTDGRRYDVFVASSIGQTGTLTGYGTSDDMVIFKSLHASTLRNLMQAKVFYVDGLGTFELTGSARAMKSAWECFEALNSF